MHHRLTLSANDRRRLGGPDSSALPCSSLTPCLGPELRVSRSLSLTLLETSGCGPECSKSLVQKTAKLLTSGFEWSSGLPKICEQHLWKATSSVAHVAALLPQSSAIIMASFMLVALACESHSPATFRCITRMLFFQLSCGMPVGCEASPLQASEIHPCEPLAAKRLAYAGARWHQNAHRPHVLSQSARRRSAPPRTPRGLHSGRHGLQDAGCGGPHAGPPAWAAAGEAARRAQRLREPELDAAKYPADTRGL